jgi:iron(III) transport system ATP-binding protein
MIEAHNLVQRHGTNTVLGDVSFNVGRGEVVALLGPSGCGKSTTLRILAGLDAAKSGVVRLNDVVVDGPSAAGTRTFIPTEQRRLAMVFQGYALWPHRNVFDNVNYPLQFLQPRMSKAEQQARTEQVLASMHLSSLAQRLPEALSGGQQQRVALGRALVGQPSILLLDEPLANLDAVLRDELRAGLAQTVRSSGAAVVLVTHDRQEAFALADRIVLLQAGKVAQVASPATLYQSPSSLFAMSFTGSTSAWPALRRGGRVVVKHNEQQWQVADDDGDDAAGTWAVRPEHMVWTTEQAPRCLPATVEHTVFAGADHEVHLRTPCGPAMMRMAADVPRRGSSGFLRFVGGRFFTTSA